MVELIERIFTPNTLSQPENPIVKNDFLDNIREGYIGKGYFGVVKIGLKQNKQYALKITLMNNYNINESKLLNSICHKNIMRTYGYMSYYDINTKLEFILLKCEYYQYDLFTLLKDYSDGYQRLKVSKVKKIMLDILNALDYLHNKKKIVHRDLKLDNILITNIDNPDAVLCDFGQAKLIGDANFSGMIYGTKGYVSPEIKMQKRPFDSRKNDMYCLGVILNLISTGHNTNDEKEDMIPQFTNLDHFKTNILHEDYTSIESESNSINCHKLFQNLTMYEFEKRILVEDALKNEWLNDEKKNDFDLEDEIENISENMVDDIFHELKPRLSNSIEDYIAE